MAININEILKTADAIKKARKGRAGDDLPTIESLGIQPTFPGEILPQPNNQLPEIPPSLKTPMQIMGEPLPEIPTGQIEQAREAEMPMDLPGIELPKAVEAPLSKAVDRYRRAAGKEYHKGQWTNITTGEVTSKRPKDGDPNWEQSKAPGIDRDKKWSTWDKIASALVGWAEGGIVGGVKAATDRNYFEKRGDAGEKQAALENVAIEQQFGKYDTDEAYKNAQTANIYDDNLHNREKFKTDMEYKREEQKRKVEDREQRAATSRMNTVAGMFKNLPEFIPGDPRYAEIEKALGDVRLPITPKDAKKKVDLKQDQRTGAWEAIITDTSGKIENRPVLRSDGTQLKTTPTVEMQGFYGLLKQNDQQGATASENEKKRRFDAAKQRISQDFTRERDAYKAAQDAFKVAKTQEARAAASAAQEESRKRILILQNELQQQRDAAKAGN